MKALSRLFARLLLVSILMMLGCQVSQAQFFKKLKRKVKQAVEQTATDRAANDASTATDSSISRSERAVGHAINNVKGNPKTGNDSTQQGVSSANGGINQAQQAGNNQVSNIAAVQNTATVPTIQLYKNYDFVPGDSVIFADDFSDDQVGELPAHWRLCYGQGQVNSFDGKRVFAMTYGEGGDNAAVLEARMKHESGYMPKAFTAEFDMYVVRKANTNDDGWAGINLYGDNNLITGYDDLDLSPGKLAFYSAKISGGSRDLPDNVADNNFVNKWHHVAIAYRDKQMKVYLDQNRIYVVPEVKDTAFNKFGIRVSGSCVVTNIRLAEGGGMTMIRKKFTAEKIVTHGITFDVNKADIRPESMGTLNMIVDILKNNPDLKFEIDGHTDNTGDVKNNFTLSQQRADAVKMQLVSMGIDASRLTTKGFGDTKPISSNETPEGRANNRRVEFVKM